MGHQNEQWYGFTALFTFYAITHVSKYNADNGIVCQLNFMGSISSDNPAIKEWKHNCEFA